MSDRGTSNAPNTRNPDRPASKPSRLDQFADDQWDRERSASKKGDVTSRQEKKHMKNHN